MALWVRFEHQETICFGTVEEGGIAVHRGSPFDSPEKTGEVLKLSEAALLAPCSPHKIVALWNNFHAAAAKQGNAIPAEPLWFLKSTSALLAPEAVIPKPPSYDGKVVYEGELGIVISKTARNVSETDAGSFILGYTCVNDVTALDILNRDASFAQWARAKSFDGFAPIGPAIATGLDPQTLTVRTLINGKERQAYPVSDMIFGPHALVSRISADITLMPGDVIACGTSLGVGVLRPGTLVEVEIPGIGVLSNRYSEAASD